MMYDLWAISFDLSCYYILSTVYSYDMQIYMYAQYIPHAKEVHLDAQATI